MGLSKVIFEPLGGTLTNRLMPFSQISLDIVRSSVDTVSIQWVFNPCSFLSHCQCMDLNFPTPQNHAPNFCCFCELQSPRYSVTAIGNKLKKLLNTPHQSRLPEHFLIRLISIYKVSQAMIEMLRKGKILSFWPIWTDQNIRCLFFFTQSE